MNLHLLEKIDPSWTLFFDRDGVINHRRFNDYVKSVDDFAFCPGATEAFYILEGLFAYHIVVTNQQGIGKELMTHEDLDSIHKYMIQEIENSHGHIDEVYYCPDLAHIDSWFRKPNPGMAYKAKEEFPKIDFKKSIMIGDSPTDMLFGKSLGMITVLVADMYSKADNNTDVIVNSLKEFALTIKHATDHLLDDKFLAKR